MSKCSGTSNEEGVLNPAKRDSIVALAEVKCFFGSFLIARNEKVSIDASAAIHHICYVINDMKRKVLHVYCISIND